MAKNEIFTLLSLVMLIMVSACVSPTVEKNIDNNTAANFTINATSPIFQFNPPLVLPLAYVGEEYLFSFCVPTPATNTTACGPMPETTDPKGGYPPYHFQVENSFPPFGIHLLKDGHLTGVPEPSDGGKTYTFTVCAVDLPHP